MDAQRDPNREELRVNKRTEGRQKQMQESKLKRTKNGKN